MIRFLKATAVALSLAFALPVIANEHPLTTIQGTQIDLKAADHAFAGSIKDFVAWGNVNEGTFSSDLNMKKDGQLIHAEFKMDEQGKFGGEIKHEVDGKPVVTTLELGGMSKADQTITMKINGQDVVVKITADDFQNNHFQNPTYTAEYNGEKVSFTLKGSACYGFSTHLSFLIFGAYFH